MTLVFRRSAIRMWLLALGGIPFLVIGLDVLTGRQITDWLRELLFRPEDTQIYEPRDVIWAWAMFLFGGFLVVWGLKELFIPTKVVECRDEGLGLKISGPFRPVSLIAWGDIVDIGDDEIEDEGTRVPRLLVTVASSDGLPDDPWGARWHDERTLAVMAEDWSPGPAEVARQVGDFAVEATKRAAIAERAAVLESRSERGHREEE